MASDWVNWADFYALNAPQMQQHEADVSAQRVQQQDADAAELGGIEAMARGDIERGQYGAKLGDYAQYKDFLQRQQARQQAAQGQWMAGSRFDSMLGNQAPAWQQPSAWQRGAEQRISTFGQQRRSAYEARQQEQARQSNERYNERYAQQSASSGLAAEQDRWDREHGVGKYSPSRNQGGARNGSTAYGMSDEEVIARAKARGDYRPGSG